MLQKVYQQLLQIKELFLAKLVVHNIDAMHTFLDGSNPVSKPIWDEVRDSYEIYELKKAS